MPCRFTSSLKSPQSHLRTLFFLRPAELASCDTRCFLMRLALALLLVCTACLQADDIALVGGTVYRSPEADPIADAVVLIYGRTIAAVGSRSSVTIPKSARIINCSGKFIAAGFWNSHVHILPPGLLHVRGKSAAQLSDQLTAMFNRWGFTTVFDLSSVLENTLALRRRIESGEVRGPRILTVGEPVLTEIPVYVRDYLTANQIQPACRIHASTGCGTGPTARTKGCQWHQAFHRIVTGRRESGQHAS